MSLDKNRKKQIPEWNLIGRIAQHRREAKRQLEEEAAAEVTNAMAAHENLILTTLKSINFEESGLPRAEPGQTPEDPKRTVDFYEHISDALCDKLVNKPMSASVDLRKIDTKIVVLAKYFKSAVEKSYPEMANLCRICLVRAIAEVREKAYEHESDPEHLARYLKDAENLLDQFIETAGFAYEQDLMQKNIDNQEIQLQQQQDAVERSINALAQEVCTNQAANTALKVILDDDPDHEDTPEELRMRSIVDELYIDKLVLKLRNLVLADARRRAQMARAQCQDMRVFMDGESVLGLDPDRLTRFNDRVKQFFEAMARHDAEYEKQAASLSSINEGVDSMKQKPGFRTQHMMQRKEAKEIIHYIAEQIAEEEREKDPNATGPSGEALELAKQMANKMLEDSRRETAEKLKQAAEKQKHDPQKLGKQTL